MIIGDRAAIVAPGMFHGHHGMVVRITQHSKASHPHYWIVFDNHPWQRPGVEWAFLRRELVPANNER